MDVTQLWAKTPRVERWKISSKGIWYITCRVSGAARLHHGVYIISVVWVFVQTTWQKRGKTRHRFHVMSDWIIDCRGEKYHADPHGSMALKLNDVSVTWGQFWWNYLACLCNLLIYTSCFFQWMVLYLVNLHMDLHHLHLTLLWIQACYD